MNLFNAIRRTGNYCLTLAVFIRVWIQLLNAIPSLPSQNRKQHALYGIFSAVLIAGYFSNSHKYYGEVTEIS